jgi:hypothetical protein
LPSGALKTTCIPAQMYVNLFCCQMTTIIEIFIWLITHTFIFLKDDGNRSFGNDTTLPLHHVEQQIKYLVCYFLSHIL